MKHISFECRFQVFEAGELNASDQMLVEAACKALSASYSPYSRFQVGAAVLLHSGRVVVGSNQENAAYGICQCAERNALFAAACQFPDDAPVAIAVAARTDGAFLSQPIPPCGSCRQAMLEVEERYARPLRILLYGTAGTWCCEGIGNLLPLKFVADTMSNTK